MIFWVHQHAHHFIVLIQKYGCRDVMPVRVIEHFLLNRSAAKQIYEYKVFFYMRKRMGPGTPTWRDT